MKVKSVEDNPFAALQVELLRAFAFLNRRHWAGRLHAVTINFHPQAPNGSRLGHYCRSAWTRSNQSDEIVFYADLCLRRGWAQVFQTLAHEMVHLWQWSEGKPGKRNYHNAEWHAEASRIGLVTTGPQGYTKSGESHLATLAAFKPKLTDLTYRKQAAASKGKLVKWVCACGFGVRVAVADFDATCNICETDFRIARVRK